MEESTWISLSQSSSTGLRWAQLISVLSFTSVTAIMVFGNEADYKFPLTMAVVAATLYGILAVNASYQGLKILSSEVPSSLASSAWANSGKKAPWGIYNAINAITILVIAFSQISILYK